jgi:hypothetical protein
LYVQVRCGAISPPEEEDAMPNDYYIENNLDFRTGNIQSKKRYHPWKEPSKRTGFREDGKWRDETPHSLQANTSFFAI